MRCAPCSEGGFFKAHMTFPPEYPNLPPKLRFKPRSLWHPNGTLLAVPLPSLHLTHSLAPRSF